MATIKISQLRHLDEKAIEALRELLTITAWGKSVATLFPASKDRQLVADASSGFETKSPATSASKP